MKKNGKIFSPFTDDGSTIWESCIIKKRKKYMWKGDEKLSRKGEEEEEQQQEKWEINMKREVAIRKIIITINKVFRHELWYF